MLKTIILSLLLGFLATWFSSPRFLRQNITLKDKRIVFRNWENKKGSCKCFLNNQFFAFIVTSFLSFLMFTLSCRICLFSGGLLLGFMFGLIQKTSKPDETIFPKTEAKKVLSFWLMAFIIYLLLFVEDNVQFRIAPILEKYEEFELSEVIDDNFLYISNEDLLKITKKDTFSTVYSIKGKYVFHPVPNNWFGIIENGVLKTVDTPLTASGVLSSSLPIPEKLKEHNPKGIGITVDDENTPYFVYALLEKKHFLGKYSVKNYALWNAKNKKIEYYEELPDFAKP